MQAEVKEFLKSVEYGTLALISNNLPYSLPINFVELNGFIYFHGSKKGKKVDAISSQKMASFSAVKEFSLIPSFFSSTDGLACPATQFFKSVIIDGTIEIVTKYQEKVDTLCALMNKLQIEGGYRDLNEPIYQKAINATLIFKLIPKETSLKVKLGQKLPKERFEMILENLERRGTKLDLETIKAMKESIK